LPFRFFLDLGPYSVFWDRFQYPSLLAENNQGGRIVANKLMIGLWRFIIKAPPSLWQKQITKSIRRFEKEHQFMTDEHRRVHHFVVRELPILGRPMPPSYAADQLNLPLDRVVSIFDDLEKHMTFLYRNPQGEVIWAYPVTVEKTPHQVTFSTGEQLYAA
jgi:hypothetical protein